MVKAKMIKIRLRVVKAATARQPQISDSASIVALQVQKRIGTKCPVIKNFNF